MLVIDDDPQVLALLARVARNADCEAVKAATATEALASLSSDRFDVVVSDIMLPDMNGLDLLVEIRGHDIDLPVIFVTGAPSVDSAVIAIQHGAFRYFTKPFNAAEVSDAIRQAVGLGRLAAIKRKALESQGLSEGIVADLAGTAARFDRALEKIWLAYQPIIRPDGSVFGYEALLRCEDPVLNRPGLVFSAAEQLGRVEEVGRVVRARVAERFVDGDPPASIFVNLHPRELYDPDLVARHGVLVPHAGRIVLEVTERAALHGDPVVATRIAELRAMGFRIAIDDLGAGYASLASFAMLQPEVVKIDMSLVHGIDSESLKSRLVRTIVDLCRDMGILVVAEGVETVEQRDAVVEIGCDLLQGFLFARPGLPYPEVASTSRLQPGTAE